MAIKWDKLSPAEGAKVLQNKWGILFLFPDPDDTDEGIFQLDGAKLKHLIDCKVFPVAKFTDKKCTFYVSAPIEKDSLYRKEYMIVYFEREGTTHVITTYRNEEQNTWVVPTYSDTSEDDPQLGTGYETQETMTWPVLVQIFLMQVYAEYKLSSVNKDPKIFESGVFVGDETPAIFWNEETSNEELVIELGQFKQRDENDAIVYQFVSGMEPDVSRIEKVGNANHKVLNRDVTLYYVPSTDGSVEYFVQYDSILKQAALASIQPSITVPRDYTVYGLNGKTFTRKSLITYDAIGTLVDKLILPFCVTSDNLPLGFSQGESEDDDTEEKEKKLAYTNAYLSKIKIINVLTKKIQELRAKVQEASESAEAKPAVVQSVSPATLVAPIAPTAPSSSSTPGPAVVATPVNTLSPLQSLIIRYQDIRLIKEDIEKNGPKQKGFAYSLFKNTENEEDKEDDVLIEFISKVFKGIETQEDALKEPLIHGLFYFIVLFNSIDHPNSKLTHFAKDMQSHELIKYIDPTKALGAFCIYCKKTTTLHPALSLNVQRIYQEISTKKN